MKELLQEWTVTRAIPQEVWDGIIAGTYKLHGGTISWAPGTEQAGQIIRHLIPTHSPIPPTPPVVGPAPGPVFAGATGALLQAATLTMVLSGLNLAVSAVGFAVLYKKLTDLDKKLGEIGKDVKEIKKLLEINQEAKLLFAMKALAVLMDPYGASGPQGQSEDILPHVLASVGPVNISYRKLLAGAPCETVAEYEAAMATQQHFTMSSLAIAHCWAELGRIDEARSQLDSDRDFWLQQARRIANSLLGDNPERFVAGEYAPDVSLSEVAAWLNFARDESRSDQEWIDDLRAKIRPTRDGIWWPWGPSKDEKIITQDKAVTIPALRQLVAQDGVLRSYAEQYALLHRYGMRPSEFERGIAALDRDQLVDGWLVLEPTQAATPA